MNTELIYDLALLAASVCLIVVGICLAAFTDIEVSAATGVVGIGAGAFAARSGRAYVSKQTSEPPAQQ